MHPGIRQWWWRGLVWLNATGAALVFAWQTKVGPHIAITSRHGVHLGDIVAFGFAYIWAAVLTVGVEHQANRRASRTRQASRR